MRNVILTDVDGVLLNWEEAFWQWMVRHGFPVKANGHYDDHGVDIAKSFGITQEQVYHYIAIFNESADIGFLPPLRDAIKYVRKLHEEHGYVFHAITSFSTNSFSYDLRRQNLIDLFGKTAVPRLVALGVRESKRDSLAPYANQGIMFIEDRIANADLAISMGIEGVLMDHDYNCHYNGAATRVTNWKEIHDYIVHGDEPSFYKNLCGPRKAS